MPRAVDPPGRFPTADMDPGQRADQTLNIATFPGFDWFKWLINELRRIIHAIITFLIDMIKFFTGGLIDLTPIHVIIDEIIDSIIEDLGTGQNLLKLWRLIVSIIETATGINLTRVLIDLLPKLIDLMGHLSEMAAASGTVVYELVMVPIRILQQIQRIFSGQPVDLSAIPEIFQPIVNALTQWWAVIGANLPGTIEQATQIAWYWAELLFTLGVNNVQAAAKLITDLWAMLGQIADVFTGQGVLEPLNPIVQQFKTWGIEVGDHLPVAIDRAAQAIWYFAELLYQIGVGNIQALAKFITDLWTALQQIGRIFSGQAVLDPINTVVQQFNSWWGNVGGGLPDLGAGLRNAIEAAGVNLNQSLADAGTQLGQAVNAASDAVWTMIEGAGIDINQTLEAASQQLAAAITGAQDAVWTIIEGAGVNVNQTLTAASEILGAAISGAKDTAQGVVDALNNAANGVAQGVGAALSTAQANLNALFNAIPTFLQGLSPNQNYNQAQINAALAAQAAANAARAAQIAQIQNEFANVFNVHPAGQGGMSQAIDFAPIPDQPGMDTIMLPANTSGPGFMGVTDGAAAWQGGTGDDIQLFPTPTETDYQVIDFTLGTINDILIPGESSLAEATGPVVLSFVLRSNPARNTYLRFDLCTHKAVGSAIYNPFFLKLVPRAVVNGTVYNITGGGGVQVITAQGALAGLASGSKFRFILGDPSSGSLNAVQVLLNGIPLLTFNAGTVPAVGAGFRYVGMRMAVAQAGYYPPAVKTVSYQDNPPPPTAYPYAGLPEPGVKGRVYLPDDVGVLLRDNGEAWERFFGGPVGYFTAPPVDGWTAIGSANASFIVDRDGLLLTLPGGAQFAGRARTLDPTSNYAATFYLEIDGPAVPAAAGQWNAGLLLRNAAGQMVTFANHVATTDPTNNDQYSGGLHAIKWNAGPTFNSLYLTRASRLMANGIPKWWRILDDGYNRSFLYSANGVDWVTFCSYLRTDFITPTQIGLWIYNYSTNTVGSQHVTVRLRSLSGIT